MNKIFDNLIRLVPHAGDTTIHWDAILDSPLSPYLSRMSKTPQNPAWHGEGDVMTHTKMVCDALIRLPVWLDLERTRQEILFLAALLHDIGKIVTTSRETHLSDDEIVSLNHPSRGDRMARSVLWKDFGLSGTFEAQQIRETICLLIKTHAIPFHFMDEGKPDHKAVRVASNGDLVSLFSNDMLSILVEADMKGRLAGDVNNLLENVSYFREISREAGCLEQPKVFPSPFSRYAYLSGRNIYAGQDLYDDTWGTVVLLSGLPGTGKDTYIQKVYPDLPVVSLDSLRSKLNISPTARQDAVISAAQEQAKEYLRRRQPFVWNATNFTPAIRRLQADLFMNYGAMVRVVFLEASWNETLIRNQRRGKAVPEDVLADMLGKLVPPVVLEAHEVEWVLV
jgi:predicted kinase